MADVSDVRLKRDAYLVEGMACSGCERAVSNAVGNVEGVQSANADLGTSTVTVEYDPQKVNIDKIRTAITRVGYKFVGERPVHGQREGSDEAVS